MLQKRLIWLGISVSIGITGCSLFSPQVSTLFRPSMNVYASLPASNAVAVMSLNNKSYTQSITVGQNPVNVVVNPRSDLEYLYTANQNDGSVSFVNLRSGVQEQAVPSGAGPWGIDVTPYDGTHQYVVVANVADHTAVRINAITKAIDHTYSLPVPFEPHGVVAVPTNTTLTNQSQQDLDVYILSDTPNTNANAGGCEVQQIKPDGTLGTKIVIPGSKQLWRAAITPDGSEMYITDHGANDLWKVKLAGGTPTFDGEITLSGAGDSVVISPTGKSAYVSIPTGSTTETINGAITFIDLNSGAITYNYATETTTGDGFIHPGALAINTTGTELWAALQNRLAFADVQESNVTNPNQWLNTVPYTSNPGQSPPISDIAMGGGIQN